MGLGIVESELVVLGFLLGEGVGTERESTEGLRLGVEERLRLEDRRAGEADGEVGIMKGKVSLGRRSVVRGQRKKRERERSIKLEGRERKGEVEIEGGLRRGEPTSIESGASSCEYDSEGHKKSSP